MTIIIRYVFEEGGKLYPQVFLDALCMNYKNAAIQKKLDVFYWVLVGMRLLIC